MPAEWEPHEATWLAWPHEITDWPGKFAPIPWVYAEIVGRLARAEQVRILVGSTEMEHRARKAILDAGRLGEAQLNSRVEFFRYQTDRSWTRDFCPTFVRSESELEALDWKFNGWAKYPNHVRDDGSAAWVASQLGVRCRQPAAGEARVVLEGGAIDVNGRGTLLTTEECLLSPVQARNPSLSREQMEQVFAEWLGIRKVLWLGRGIAGDDTHGHVDDLCRFVDPSTVVTVVEPDPADPNHEPLADNLARLREMTDQDGRPLRVETLPMPEPVFFRGQRLPASYANFYIANGLVLAPVFNDPRDRLALDTLARLMPDREVVGMYCVDLVLGLGTLHCMTQQQPALLP